MIFIHAITGDIYLTLKAFYNETTDELEHQGECSFGAPMIVSIEHLEFVGWL